jgi:hypothetical protein
VVVASTTADDQPLVAVAKEATRDAPGFRPAICAIAITHFHPISPFLLYTTPLRQPPAQKSLPHIPRSSAQPTRPNDMSCKRKRSADDSPLSVSSFGAVSTPGTQSPTPFPHSFHGSMQMDVDSSARHSGWDFASASRVKSGDWGNRTRKRFRDNRADERAIHGMSPEIVPQINGVLIACRKHATETLLRATQPSRRIARTVRHHTRPTACPSHLETAKVHAALVLETTARTARSTTHLLVPNATTTNRRTAATLRRLRHPAAERERQHGRRHGHGHGRGCREQPLCLQRLWQERMRNLRSSVGKKALSGMRHNPHEFGAVLVTINMNWFTHALITHGG